MSDTRTTVEDHADVSAEKTQATAIEVVPAKADDASPVPQPEAASAKPARARKAAVKPVAAKPAVAAPAPPAGKPRRGRPPKVRVAAVAAAAPAKREPIPAAPKRAAKASARKAPAAKITTARPVAVTPARTPVIPTASQLKEKTMSTNTKFTDGIKTVVSDAQEKAKEVYSKGAAFAGEYGEFTKGNLKAAVASTKILATGLKDMGDTLIADTKEAVETASADFRSLSAVKSPSEFVQLQSELLQRNIDKAVAYNSKATESLLKLTNEVFAPVSERFSLAVEKIRKAA